MIIEKKHQGRWSEVVRAQSAYYAISIARLLELMSDAGLHATRVDDADFFQPVLRGGAV